MPALLRCASRLAYNCGEWLTFASLGPDGRVCYMKDTSAWFHDRVAGDRQVNMQPLPDGYFPIHHPLPPWNTMRPPAHGTYFAYADRSQPRRPQVR